MQMGRHLDQQPELVDKLVGIAIEALSLKQLNRFIITDKPTSEQLSAIEYTLSEIKHDWSSDLSGFLECDKLMMKSLFSIFYDINLKGKTRLSHNPYKKIIAHLQEELEKEPTENQDIKKVSQEILPLTYLRKKLLKASVIVGWFFFPPNPQKASEIIDASYERYYAISKPNYNRESQRNKSQKWPKFNFSFMIELLANITDETYCNIHDLYLRTKAQQKGAQILIALRRYKNKYSHWPESLDDVKVLAPAEVFIDPFNGGSFVYKLTEENFKLYSKGKNKTDENGIREKEDEGVPDDWLIWPPKNIKEDEEKSTDDK
jgi:hypothetical protein